MASKSKIKGNYHENWFVKLFTSWKLPCKKVPLSGSLGGEHTGDIKLMINKKEYVVEIKYRAKCYKEKILQCINVKLVNQDGLPSFQIKYLRRLSNEMYNMSW